MQTIVLHGKITQELKLEYTANGTAMLKFSLAVNESEKKDNKWVEYTEWFNCVVWGKRAETIAQYVKVKDYIELRVKRKTNKYEKDGKQVKFFDFVVQDFGFGGSSVQKGTTAAVNKPSVFDEVLNEVQSTYKVEPSKEYTTDDIPF